MVLLLYYDGDQAKEKIKGAVTQAMNKGDDKINSVTKHQTVHKLIERV
jgi:hypothetical protein